MLRFRRKSANIEDMKRDMDLIREILLFAEKHCDGKYEYGINVAELPQKYHNINEFELREHITLTIENGLIEASGAFGDYSIGRLTWEGHEFLGNARSPKAWNTAKRIAGHLSLSAFTGVLTRLASERAIELLDHFLAVASGGGS